MVALVTVAGALLYLHLTGDLDANMVIATTLGVFFSVLLGCGLFAAAFFSSKSGIDDQVADATRNERANSGEQRRRSSLQVQRRCRPMR